MEHSKTTIREFIANGQLEEGTKAALSYAEYCGLSDVANALTSLSARSTAHQNKWNSGQLNYEDFSLAHAKITHDLTAWVSRLPEHPKPAGRRRKLLTEGKFKNRIFFLLILVKVIVFIRLYYHWSTGGFTLDQFQGTATLLMPALAAYITVILGDYLRQQKMELQHPRYISGPLVTFGYWLFPIYAILLILFIEMKVKGTLSFTQMNTWLALVESILGGYVGKIVHSLFKEKN